VAAILKGSRNDDVIRVRSNRGSAALIGKLGRGNDILYVESSKSVGKVIDTGPGDDIVFFEGRRAAQALETGSGNDLICVQNTATALRAGSGNDAVIARNHVGSEDMGTGRDSIRILKGSRNSTTTVDVRDGKGDDRIDARRTKGSVCRVDPGDRTQGCVRIR
jgi:Ca2+-binding RTX toxin-like protein